jgi:hypothetical protein
MDSGEATMSIAIQPEMVRAYRIVGGPRRMTLDAAVRRYAQDLFRDRYRTSIGNEWIEGAEWEFLRPRIDRLARRLRRRVVRGTLEAVSLRRRDLNLYDALNRWRDRTRLRPWAESTEDLPF